MGILEDFNSFPISGRRNSFNIKDWSTVWKKKNNDSTTSVHQASASIVETANDGPFSTNVGGENKQFVVLLTRQNGQRYTSPTTHISLAAQPAKLLQILKRKVSMYSGNSRFSSVSPSSADDATEDSNRKNVSGKDMSSAVLERVSVDDLHAELQQLRHRLEREEAEMQRLRTEVSCLRQARRGPASVQQQSPSQPLLAPVNDTNRPMARNLSVCSDSSQLSCLDFSVASSGILQFEGKVKARISPRRDLQINSGEFLESFLSDASAAAASCRTAKFSGVAEVDKESEVRGATKSRTSLNVKVHASVEEMVEATLKNLGESKEEKREPEYQEKYCHTGADQKVAGILTHKFHSYGSEDEYLSAIADNKTTDHCKASRSPPDSCRLSIEKPSVFSSYGAKMDFDSDYYSLALQEAVGLKMVRSKFGLTSPESPKSLSNIDVDKKLVDMGCPEDLDAKALKSPGLDGRTNDSTEKLPSSNASACTKDLDLTVVIPSVEPRSVRSPVMEKDPLKEPRLQQNVASNNSIPLASSALRRKTLLTIETRLKNNFYDAWQVADLVDTKETSFQETSNTNVSTGTSQVESSADEVPLTVMSKVSQVAIAAACSLARKPWVEHSRTVDHSWNKSFRDLQSGNLLMARSDIDSERVAGRNSSNVDELQLRGGNWRGSYGSGNDLIHPPVSTAVARREQFSYPSSPNAPRDERHSPSRYFDGPQLLHQEPESKPNSGSGHQVWEKLSSHLKREDSQEEVDLEEEIRQCLEQSRLLLQSDASSTEDEHSATQLHLQTEADSIQDDYLDTGLSQQFSRDESFSVLAHSRHRRSKERNKRSLQIGSPEKQQQEQQGTVLDFEEDTLDIQSSRDGTHTENEFYSVITPGRLREAIEKWDNKNAQLCELDAGDKNFRSTSSLPRMSRFYLEAASLCSSPT